MFELILIIILLFIFRDFIFDYLIPLAFVLVLLFSFGSALYSSAAEKWAVAESTFDYAMVIGEVVLILGIAAFFIWALLSKTGNVILKAAAIVVAIIGALYIAVYSYKNFGGIYGIIAACILAVFGYRLFTGQAVIFQAFLAAMNGYRASDYDEKRVCSDCIHYEMGKCAYLGDTKERHTCNLFRHW